MEGAGDAARDPTLEAGDDCTAAVAAEDDDDAWGAAARAGDAARGEFATAVAEEGLELRSPAFHAASASAWPGGSAIPFHSSCRALA